MIHDWKTSLDAHFDKRARDFIHTSFPAKITRIVNAGVVDVLPQIATLRPDGSIWEFPELFNVRIMSYACNAGDVYISLPYKVGDNVWVNVSERDVALLMSNDQVVASSPATHDLSDCFCFPTYFTDTNIPEYSTDDLVIGNKSTTITVKEEGIVINTQSFEVNASSATFNCPVTMSESLSVLGDTTLSGDIKHKGVDIGKDHKHISVQIGTGESGIVKV